MIHRTMRTFSEFHGNKRGKIKKTKARKVQEVVKAFGGSRNHWNP